MSRTRRLPIGAEMISSDGVEFRVWAPRRQRIEVVFEGTTWPSVVLSRDSAGYFAGHAGVKPGTLYRFRLDNESTLLPDPASRFQPQGPHGPSQVVDPDAFH